MKSTYINDYIVKSNQTPWKPLKEEGVDTTGISVKVLRYNQEQHRPPTFLLRFEPGASYPTIIILPVKNCWYFGR